MIADNSSGYPNLSANDANMTVNRNNTVIMEVATNISIAGPVKQVSPLKFQAIPNTTRNIAGNTDEKGGVPDFTPITTLPMDAKKGNNLQDYQGTFTSITVGTEGSDQRYPSIFGDNLVWLDGRNGEQAVYMYNFNTCQEKMICNTSPAAPVIYGNLIGYGSRTVIMAHTA